MKTETLPADHPVAVAHALDVLRNGGLVAFPTDTVYGLACTLQAGNVERLLAAKGRSNERAVGVLLARLTDLTQLTPPLPPEAERLVRRFWPGLLTLLLPAVASLPTNLIVDGLVGLRIPNHALALALLAQSGPLAVTSANLSGQPVARTPAQVLQQMNGRIHLLLDGGPVAGQPSTVVDFRQPPWRIVRPGPISQQQLQQQETKD